MYKLMQINLLNDWRVTMLDILLFVFGWLLGSFLCYIAKDTVCELCKKHYKLILSVLGNIIAMAVVMYLLGYFDFILYTEK